MYKFIGVADKVTPMLNEIYKPLEILNNYASIYPELTGAYVGFSFNKLQKPVAVYDVDLSLEILKTKFDLNELDAKDWLENKMITSDGLDCPVFLQNTTGLKHRKIRFVNDVEGLLDMPEADEE